MAAGHPEYIEIFIGTHLWKSETEALELDLSVTPPQINNTPNIVEGSLNFSINETTERPDQLQKVPQLRRIKAITKTIAYAASFDGHLEIPEEIHSADLIGIIDSILNDGEDMEFTYRSDPIERQQSYSECVRYINDILRNMFISFLCDSGKSIAIWKILKIIPADLDYGGEDFFEFLDMLIKYGVTAKLTGGEDKYPAIAKYEGWGRYDDMNDAVQKPYQHLLHLYYLKAEPLRNTADAIY